MRELIFTLQVKNLAGATIFDPLFLKMADFRKQSIYPAGTFGQASFTLPRNIVQRPSLLAPGFEVTIVDGVTEIYHGWVDGLEDISTGAGEGTRVECVGDWAKFMERRGIERNWADRRLSSREWHWQDSGGGENLATINYGVATPATGFNQAVIIPKSDAWANSDTYSVIYDMPTGETIGRLICDYELAEAGQQWTLQMYNRDAAAVYWSVTTSSTGSQDVTVAGGSLGQSAQIQLVSNAAQTPSPDTIYGKVSDLTLYATRDHSSATLGNVNIYEIALDIVDRLGVDEGSISADVTNLDSALTLSLIPFVTNGFESYASILSRAAGYGTSSQEAIGYGLRPPSYASDGRPQLFIETYPALSGYDYEISTDDSSFSVRLNLDNVWNWIAVEYRDSEGVEQSVTPDDDSSLKNTASINQYGQREKVLRIKDSGITAATDYGQRFLDRHKQPTYAVTRPLRVSRLRSKGGTWVHASKINAGKRVRVLDLPNRIGQQSDTGTTFIITRADYDHNTQTANLSIGGVPDDLAIWLSQLELGA